MKTIIAIIILFACGSLGLTQTATQTPIPKQDEGKVGTSISGPGISGLPVQNPGSILVLQTERTARIAEIQTALQKEGFAGWLFYDFRGSDILVPRILKTGRLSGSRRWFYYIPSKGEPVKVVHAIEPDQLDSLPGKKLIYREWQLCASRSAKPCMGKPRTPETKSESRCSIRRITTFHT